MNFIARGEYRKLVLDNVKGALGKTALWICLWGELIRLEQKPIYCWRVRIKFICRVGKGNLKTIMISTGALLKDDSLLDSLLFDEFNPKSFTW